MSQPVSDSILLIRGKDERRFGTGFIIYKTENTTYILTCAHVVDDVGGPENLHVGPYPATLTVSDESDGFDLAILEIAEALPQAPLTLQITGDTDTPFNTTGFYLYGKKTLSKAIVGRLADRQSLFSKQLQRHTTAWLLEMETTHRLQQGYSGSPVIDEENGTVFGVISDRQGEGESGLAVSVEALNILWPTMPKALHRLLNPPPPINPPQQSLLMNFEKEIGVFKAILRGEDKHTRLILIDGVSGIGKSRLKKEYEQLANQHALPTLPFNLKQQLNIDTCLETLVNHLGAVHFKHYDAFLSQTPFNTETQLWWYQNLTRKFFLDLTRLNPTPCPIVLFDQYEGANPLFKKWLKENFLSAALATPMPTLLIIVAGQEAIDPPAVWRNYHAFHLKHLPLACFQQYVQTCGVPLDSTSIQHLHGMAKGLPKPFVDYIQTLFPTHRRATP